MLLIVNANLTEQKPQILTQYIRGRYYDYIPRWYSDVGYNIVQTMIINSIMPYVGLILGWLIPALYRFYDRRWTKDVYQTRQKSMGDYKSIHLGSEYVSHVKYSNVLVVVYITMMYGVGMPILFPIAAFNFLNQYICERIVVAR